MAELKNHLSRYLDHVRAGGSVLVMDRNQPVACLVPLSGRALARRGVDGRLIRLERQGLIRRGAGGLPAWLREPPHRVRGSVLQDLLDERESGW